MCWFFGLNRSIIVALLLFSPLFMMLGGQMTVVAIPVTSMTTQTTTTFLTLTGTGATTTYQTNTQVTSFPTTTWTTYTTTGVVAVPVQVLTTVVNPVPVLVTVAGGHYCVMGPGGTQVCTTTMAIQTSIQYVTQTGYIVAYSPSTVQGAVTSQYLTNVPTTQFSTVASTSTYATGQVVSMTNTQTFTSVTDVQPPAPTINDILSQNLLIILVLVAVVLGALGYGLGRRGGRGSPRVAITSGFCSSCGSRIPEGAEFCVKCGAKRTSA